MAEDMIVVDLNEAKPGKYRVDLATGKWGEVEESVITIENLASTDAPRIPFAYFLKERPPVSISGKSLGTLKSLLVVLPKQGKALKRLFLNGKLVRDHELEITFKPTDAFLDVFLIDPASLDTQHRDSTPP